jgi:hypothetical protein
MKANWINFAMLAAMPIFGLSLLLLFSVRALAMHVCIYFCHYLLAAISTMGNQPKVVLGL